ncbi:hypothetical protein MICPUN_113364 [Micromonas commoda]|uniref:IPT/TIG domain-containing protein n=1 Tax=Micromonas commoda (strain RCC299 / NOUM17 / CCMP2709) TaxID=296587 RepID=C1FDU4_MICCC|nr:hypothetical protein MICPUN_113364 [Micromonas commoda]ACO68846.1 hypothetical protein MICPUN_113364 [Micromonas commoda]|eukprot:XP_002507588.1 hypothetical protein MICPUN_113364 [Micromonas commoda]
MPRAHSKAALPSVFLAVTLLTWSCFQYAFAHAGFLGVVVMPTANYVSEGIALTVSGFNFINLGEHRVLVQAETVPREFYQDGLDTIACLFAQSSHGKPISSATVIGEHSVACVLPLTLRPGFVSVGVSTNGIDSFFHSEVTVSVRARPELYHVIGSRIQSGGDHAHVIGDGLEPRQAHSALPGHALLCGWHTPIGINSRNEKVSLGAGGTPGVFVSSAVRVCEIPAVFGHTVKLFAAAEPGTSSEDVLATKEDYTTSHGPAILSSDPPIIVAVRPWQTNSGGGSSLSIDSVRYCDDVSSLERLSFKPLLRFGTAWVDISPHSPPTSEQIQIWRSVSPAYKPTDTEGAPLAIVSTHYTSKARNPCWQRSFEIETGLSAHYPLPLCVVVNAADSALITWIRGEQFRPLSIEEVASYLVIGIGEPIGTEFHFSSQARAQSYHDVLGVAPSTGAEGGGGIVWVSRPFSQLEASRKPAHHQGQMTCTFGLTEVSLVFISSALMACEAPTYSSTRFPRTVPVNIGFDYMPALESIGTYTYLQHIFVSEPEPDAGPSAGGTKITVTTSKAEPLAALLVPICRFGNIVVVGSFSDIGGVVACITPAASSSSISFFMDDNKGACAPSGSIFTDHRSRNYHYDYFHEHE